MAGQDFRDVALRALRRIEQLEAEVAAGAGRSSPIAIVGLGCRLPGAEHPQQLWELLMRGGDAVGAAPTSRWSATDLASLGADARETQAASRGGFVQEPDLFDPEFFGISPREAETLDPQQRLLLEVAWEALHDAGLPLSALPKSRTGVFVGISGMDYALELAASPEGADPYLTTGSAHSVASGRLAYVFGLGGPAVSIDTACSSSAVAVHLACRSLQAGDCDVALAGGVNRLLLPHMSLQFARANMLSTKGRCHSFSDDADGFVRSEGCGIVVLKRLDQAERDGDRVYAVIEGSATNQDGRSSGLTVPNGAAQERVILDALNNARVTPDDVGYVEAHGTGTRLGDPIELRALERVHRDRAGRKLLVGSIKANLGHVEAAAGVAGVIKSALMLWRNAVPPHAPCGPPTREIGWDRSPFEIAPANLAWPTDLPRRVGVSSFGFSGTNAHLVIGAAARPSAPLVTPQVELLVISARSQATLEAVAARMRAHAVSIGDVSALAYTVACRGDHFGHRAYAVVSPDHGEIVFDLDDRAKPLSASGASGIISPSALERWPSLRQALDDLQDHAAAVSAFLGAIRGAPLSDEDRASVVFDEAGILWRIGQAYKEGLALDWRLVFPRPGPVTPPPPYPFERRSLLKRRWRPASLTDAEEVFLRPVRWAPAHPPLPVTSTNAEDRLVETPGDLAGAERVLADALARPGEALVCCIPPLKNPEHERVAALLIAAASVLRLERPNSGLACLEMGAGEKVDWPRAALAQMVARGALWKGGVADAKTEVIGPKLRVDGSPSPGTTMVVGSGQTANALAEALRAQGERVEQRGWEAAGEWCGGADRIVAIVPRARRREVITSGSLKALIATYEQQAAGLEAAFDAFTVATSICLVRGVESTFGWPGRLVDAALGRLAWRRAGGLAARGVKVSCLDWPSLVSGEESADELARVAAHGMAPLSPRALAAAVGTAVLAGGRLVAHGANEHVDLQDDTSVSALASGFRAYGRPTNATGDGSEHFIGIVREVLGLARLGDHVSHSLLELGADSLMALEIAKRSQAELGVEIDIQDLLSDFSVGALASRLATGAPEADPTPLSDPRRQHVVAESL